ncbi:MAG: hypothetical protein QOJ19_3219 [Acidimicrobiia bacterium]|nr:hypothetical protein [Acidimicrobiia bacterium]
MVDSRVATLLRQFRETDQARMNWEAETAAAELAARRRLKSDASVQAELQATGVDVRALEAESSRSAASVARAFAAGEEPEGVMVAPPRLGAMVAGAFHGAPLHTLSADVVTQVLSEPAFEAWGNAEVCGANLQLREVNLLGVSHGSGWGWDAVGVVPQECTLWVAWWPPRAGDLTVRLNVEAKGRLRAIAEDHWWSGTSADAHLEVRFDLYQHYFDGEIRRKVVDFYSQNADVNRVISESFAMVKTLSVSDQAPVLIKFTTAFWVLAHSEYAAVRCDFRTGDHRYVRLTEIDLTLR